MVRARDRLELIARLFRPTTEAFLRRTGALDASRFLDVGCGIGDVTGLVAAHGGGRGAAVLLMALLPAASDEGLGASYLSPLRRSQALTGAAVGALAVCVGLGWWSPLAVLAAAGLACLVGAYARRTLGGLTGDVLGAAEQVAEVAILLVAVAATG